MLVKRSLSFVFAFVIAFLAGCGGYGRQTSGVVPTSLVVTPMMSSQSIGDSQQFIATATFSDNSTRNVTAQAGWTSSATSVAMVTLAGLANPIAQGDTTISASYSAAGRSLTASAALHVTVPDLQSISIVPSTTQLELGANQQFVATGRLTDGSNRDLTQAVSWSSSDQNVLRVNTSPGRIGLANTRGPGTATIRASLNGFSAASPVTVIRRVPKFLYAAGDTGIIGYSINPNTGALAPLPGGTFSATGFIRSLARTRDRKFLYAADSDTRAIWGFRIDPSGALVQVPGSPFTMGAGNSFQSPFSVLASPTSDFLFMTDFGTGLLTTFAIGADGSLAAQGSSVNVGSSPFRATISYDGRFTYQTSSTPAQIAGFSIDENGVLAAIGRGTIATGARPDDVTVDPSGRFLYATLSDGSPGGVPPAVLGFAIDSLTGGLTPLPGSPFNGGDGPFSTATDASGRFLYVGSAGTDSSGGGISGFSIDSDTGVATAIPGASLSTRLFSISVAVDPSAQFVYVGHRGNQGIQAFRIDQQTGALTEITGSPFSALDTVFAITTTY
ncbi:MAG TPA: beta-propeller fold lactonase family protein [Candidatus Acidoferrum sp.]|nr:beta-propeller fold lactonase family protein [Candidatus Acidoferrum sp.]